MLSDVNESNCSNVCRNPFSDSEVDEVEDKTRELVKEGIVRFEAAEVIGEEGSEVTENDLWLSVCNVKTRTTGPYGQSLKAWQRQRQLYKMPIPQESKGPSSSHSETV